MNVAPRVLRSRAVRLLRRGAILGLACMLVLGAGNWWPSTVESPRRREIRMRGNSFAPRDVRVAVGDTVVWVNGDIVRHNAMRRDLFDSGDLRSGERFAWVPADTGTVRYQCTIHSRMRGTIQVTKSR